MPDARTIAAVHAACPRNDGACAYPGCACSVPIVVRHALAAADAWEADHSDPSSPYLKALLRETLARAEELKTALEEIERTAEDCWTLMLGGTEAEMNDEMRDALKTIEGRANAALAGEADGAPR